MAILYFTTVHVMMVARIWHFVFYYSSCADDNENMAILYFHTVHVLMVARTWQFCIFIQFMC